MEEEERLPTDDDESRWDTAEIQNGRNDTETARHSSATSGGLEKSPDVEIVDWDGPNDPENPYARYNMRLE